MRGRSIEHAGCACEDSAAEFHVAVSVRYRTGDGARQLYPCIPALFENRLRVGSLIVADHAAMCPANLIVVRDPKDGYPSVPFGEDLELCRTLRWREIPLRMRSMPAIKSARSSCMRTCPATLRVNGKLS